MAQLPIDLAETPAGTDIQGMRRWVQELFTSDAYAKEKARFKVRRRRPVAEVGRSIVSVPCSDGGDECFNLWIYEPQNEEASPRPKSRPAILMLHGGGWIHGTPIGDERRW
jgi:acetyl esterase/lipase